MNTLERDLTKFKLELAKEWRMLQTPPHQAAAPLRGLARATGAITRMTGNAALALSLSLMKR